jgi:hypothetical protein
MAEGLESRIEDVAAKPASVSVDGQSVSEQSINDLIAADKYLAAKAAAGKSHMGLRITKLKMPGARGKEPDQC